MGSEEEAEAEEAVDVHWEAREAVKAHGDTVAAVRMFWELMVMESKRYGGNGVEVNREGYRNFHLRVSKSLDATFDMATAEAVANKDWAEDITAFSGDSADLIWLEEVKKKFRDVTQNTVTRNGWSVLFARYDTDGSGEIDLEEFVAAARMECKLETAVVSDEQLQQLFSEADADGSGELDSDEFSAWLVRSESGTCDSSPADNRLQEIKQIFYEATKSMVNKIGWGAVFASYDTDGSGALDKQEFVAAVRKDCDLNERVLSDADLGKMFDAVDADGSGEIDCVEFEELLNSDALAQDMIFDIFYAAMFQLVDLWTIDPPDVSNYCSFLVKILGNITKFTADGTMTLRDLSTLYDENGLLMYELAPVEEIHSFVDETSGDVCIEGVEINDDMLAAYTTTPPPASSTPTPTPEPEPELEPQPERLPTEVVDSEIETRSPTPKMIPKDTYDADAEAARLAKEAAQLAALEEERRRQEAERLAREAAEAERRRREAERRAKRREHDVTVPLPRSQRDRKARREAVRKRQVELRLEERQHCHALEQMALEQPAWWAQVDRLFAHLSQFDISKLDSKLVGEFATWTDAKKLVHALVRAICKATADIDRGTAINGNLHEAVAIAVAKELRNNGEMAGLLRLVMDGAEPGIPTLPADITAANNVVGARLLTWLQRILAIFLEGSELRPIPSSPKSTLPALIVASRAVVTPGTAKRRQVNAKKELLWRQAQESRTMRSTLQPRLRRVQNGRKRQPDIATARRKLQSLSYSKDGQDPMKLFRQYDHDNSGDLDFEEFSNAVRKGGQMMPSMISDAELAALFAAVDGDASGDISILELQAFVWGSGGTSTRGTKAKVAEVKLPAVDANQTNDAGHHRARSTPLPRYMQSLGTTDARRYPVPPTESRPKSVYILQKEEENKAAVASYCQSLQPITPVPSPPTASKLPPMTTSGVQRLQEQRVSFSRERPTDRRIESFDSGPRGRGTPRHWGAPGTVKPTTPVYSLGRRFLPPESVDWSKSITARF